MQGPVYKSSEMQFICACNSENRDNDRSPTDRNPAHIREVISVLSRTMKLPLVEISTSEGATTSPTGENKIDRPLYERLALKC